MRAEAVLVLAVFGLSAISVLAAFRTTRAAMVAVESFLTLLLNASLGSFAPWDWFVILCAHPGALYAVMMTLLALFAVEGWVIRRSHYGRLFGYGLVVLLIALAVGLVVDIVSFRLAQRVPPWIALAELDDLRRFYRTDFLSMSAADGYIDGNLVAWSCAVVLLWDRARRTAGAMLGFVALHAFGEIALGEQWPIAHVLAVLTGMGIGGAGLLHQDAVFAHAERRMEDFFVARAWRRLTPAAVRDDLPKVEVEGFRVLIDRPTERREQQIINRVWLRLVEREVLPVIALQPGDYVLSRSPSAHADVAIKRSRYVRFLRSPRGEIFVIKAAWRWGSPFKPASRILRYRLHARNAISLERLHFPVPRLYWAREGFLNFGLRRYFLLVEEFVPGRPLDRHSLEQSTGAIRLLAQLHENRRFSWGAVSESGRPSVEEYIWTSFRPRVMYCLDRLQKLYGPVWPADLSTRIWAGFEARAFRLSGPDAVPFRLTHGDVTRNNFLWTPDGAKMLDLLTLGYEWVGPEILKACISFATKPPAWRRELWLTYFREAGDARWREYQRQAGIAAAFFMLREFAQGRAFGDTRRSGLPDPEAFALRVNYALHEDSIWGASPAETDWQALDNLFNRPIGTLRIDRPERGATIVDASPSASTPA